jgi:cytoskeletal protein CcmA (bactofilin family)
MDGQIEGTITLTTSRLTIGPNAIVNADISVHDVIIFGKVDGNIKAAGTIDLRQSAVVTGDILAGRLAIEESAIIKGRVELNPAGVSAS